MGRAHDRGGVLSGRALQEQPRYNALSFLRDRYCDERGEILGVALILALYEYLLWAWPENSNRLGFLC